MKLRLNEQLIVVISLFVLFSACVPKNLPPELKPAYTANEVLIRVHELQKLTIGLFDSKPPLISKQRADLIVKFTVSAAEVIKNSLTGWQATLKSMWKQLNQLIPDPPGELNMIWTLTGQLVEAI